MDVQEAKNSKVNYDDLVGKTVRYLDQDYVVQDIVIVPSDSSFLAEYTDGYLLNGFDEAVKKLPSNTDVEIGLLCNEIVDGSAAILKVTEVEFLL
jgi:hypothetical protein